MNDKYYFFFENNPDNGMDGLTFVYIVDADFYDRYQIVKDTHIAKAVKMPMGFEEAAPSLFEFQGSVVEVRRILIDNGFVEIVPKF